MEKVETILRERFRRDEMENKAGVLVFRILLAGNTQTQISIHKALGR